MQQFIIITFCNKMDISSCLWSKTNTCLLYCASWNASEAIKLIDDLELRSDHRVVQTYLILPPVDKPKTQHKRKRYIDWTTYNIAAKQIRYGRIYSLPVLEKELCELGDSSRKEHKVGSRPWDIELTHLKEKCATTALERKEVLNKIWR